MDTFCAVINEFGEEDEQIIGCLKLLLLFLFLIKSPSFCANGYIDPNTVSTSFIEIWRQFHRAYATI